MSPNGVVLPLLEPSFASVEEPRDLSGLIVPDSESPRGQEAVLFNVPPHNDCTALCLILCVFHDLLLHEFFGE